MLGPDTEGSLHASEDELGAEVVGGELGDSPGQPLLLPLGPQGEVAQLGIRDCWCCALWRRVPAHRTPRTLILPWQSELISSQIFIFFFYLFTNFILDNLRLHKSQIVPFALVLSLYRIVIIL